MAFRFLRYMDNSEFSQTRERADGSVRYAEVMKLPTQGATCEALKVRIYGKLHFLKRPIDRGDGRLRDSFRKEFEIGFNLDHPGVARYVAFDADEGLFAEWIEGSTLDRFIVDNPRYFCKRGNLERFVTQLLDAVGYLHSHSVVHRDLKPENIMITDVDRSVKIIDLGFAVSDSFDTTPGLTRQFAAPEQMEQGMPVDCRADIYAIGRIVEYIADCGGYCSGCYRRFISMTTAADPAVRPATAAQAMALLRRRSSGWIWGMAIGVAIAVGLIVYYMADDKAVEALPQEVAEATAMRRDTIIADDVEVAKPMLPAVEKPKMVTKSLSPAERLDTAEARMGAFVAVRGHYALKREWYARQYHAMDSMRRVYLATDTAQRMGSRLNMVLNSMIERDCEAVARLFPGESVETVRAVGYDVSRVLVYMCYSDRRLYTDTDRLPSQYYDYARRKAALLGR